MLSKFRPRMAANTHFVYLSQDDKDETIAAIDLGLLELQTRETYSGPLVLGEDLMTFDISGEFVVRKQGEY